MSKKTVSLLLSVVFLLTFLLTGCGGQDAAKAKVLKVGTNAEFAPFEFQDEQSKEYTGFDIDLIKAIGKQMGYEIQISNMAFDGLIPALQSKNIDVAVAGMTINEERQQKVTFAKAYYKSGLSIIVKNTNNTINGIKDLEGKTVGVQIGTTGAKEAKKIKNVKIREFNSSPDAYLDLKNGGVEAVLTDLPVNEYYLAKGGSQDAKAVGAVLNSEDYGFAVAKDNTELAEKITKALDELKQNGEYDKIYIKWFGKKPVNQ